MTDNKMLPKKKDRKDRLTDRQQIFVEKYLECRNASEAAREAGYKGRADVTGTRVKQIPKVAKLIQERLDEYKLDADTVLTLLSEQAKISPAMFFEFDIYGKPTGDLNWKTVRGPEGKHIREMKQGKDGWEIKLHDSQNALIWLGKNHALWIERLDIQAQTYLKGYETISPDDWDDEPIREN